VLHIAAPSPCPPKDREEQHGGGKLQRGFALLAVHGYVLCVYGIVPDAGGWEERLFCVVHGRLRREAKYPAWWEAFVAGRAVGRSGGLRLQAG
jgi:hypothetical protein